MTRLRLNTANIIPSGSAAKSPIGEKNFYDCRKSSRSYVGMRNGMHRIHPRRMCVRSHVEPVRSQLESASPAGAG